MKSERFLIQKLKRDMRGAVTVLVTLLLIPALLLTGTGVDIARMYSSQSILHDANQLAANSALASYDALLHDLYGLFGIMIKQQGAGTASELFDDAELAAAFDEYVKYSIYPKDGRKEFGTFQLFYGSVPKSVTIAPAPEKNLANVTVLRRQIEEYSKFRAPVIIAQDIIGRLDTFEQVQENADIINDKMEIEEEIEELEDFYRKIYNGINEANHGKTVEEDFFVKLNGRIDDIHAQFRNLYDTRLDYWEVMKNRANDIYAEEKLEELEEKFDQHALNIRYYIIGTNAAVGAVIREAYIKGDVDDEGNYQKGRWTGTSEVFRRGSKDVCVRTLLSNTSSTLRSYQGVIQRLVNFAKEADKRKEKIKDKIRELRNKLEMSQCDESLKEGIREQLKEYDELTKYDIEPMAKDMQDRDVNHNIQGMLLLMEEMGYGRNIMSYLTNEEFLNFTGEKAASLSGRVYPISEKGISDEENYEGTILSKIYRPYTSPYHYSTSSTYGTNGKFPGSYEKFQDLSEESSLFYGYLETLFKTDPDNKKKQNFRDNLAKTMKGIQDKFKSSLALEPGGAWEYKKSTGDEGEDSIGFGSDGDWGKEGEAQSQLKTSLDSSLVKKLGEGLNQAVNKILLLTYASEMFSCYSTSKRGGEAEKSMSGIPLDIKVNYFYQSELEYLYHGNDTDAKANLKAVAGMIFLIRFVMDYIMSFSIDAVNDTVKAVRTALGGLGPFAVVAGELVRAAMALGEGVMDLSRLQLGDEVILVKTNETWKFSLSNLVISAATLSFDDNEGEQKNDDDTEEGVSLSYKDYMRLFLLMVDGDTLARRVKHLIELNVTNYKEGIGNIGGKDDHVERENAMAGVDLIRLDRAMTDFSITTIIDMKMLFLSMPFAQRGIDGVVPPGTLQYAVTDYRGY